MKTKSFDPQAYEIAIRRVVEDGEVLFKGTVRELPDVAVYQESYKDAYDGVVCVIQELHSQAVEQARPFPQPSEVEEEFSGRVTLRLTKTIHRHAALAAEREGVSLNHFISTVVATYVGALFGGYSLKAPTFVTTDAAFDQVRFHCNASTRRVQERGFAFPQETSVTASDVIQLVGAGSSFHVKTHELLNLVKTTQPRVLLPTELAEKPNAH
jgi:predicted HicB family RNase H-like nuclease